jgi:CHAD domain-containing protein
MSQNPNNSGLPVGPEQRQSRLVFDRMSRYIGRLSRDSKSADVHRFRTNSRRVEALIGQLAPETRNKKKLLKLLSKLRKKAGKLRDLDVQIAFLKNLKIPDRQNHRAQLLEALSSEQVRRSRKLPKSFDAETVRELRKRLRREQSEMKLNGIDPVRLAFERLPNPGQAPLTEKTLHACRIAAKHSRYLAELAAESADAKAFVDELKRAQDVIGEWHDVLKLKGKAERQFGSVHDSALVSALQNISRARFRRAVNALLGTIAAISEMRKPKPAEAERRKAVETDSDIRSAAVA